MGNRPSEGPGASAPPQGRLGRCRRMAAAAPRTSSSVPGSGIAAAPGTTPRPSPASRAPGASGRRAWPAGLPCWSATSTSPACSAATPDGICRRDTCGATRLPRRSSALTRPRAGVPRASRGVLRHHHRVPEVGHRPQPNEQEQARRRPIEAMLWKSYKCRGTGVKFARGMNSGKPIVEGDADVLEPPSRVA